jgi:hypothetical protein
VYQGSEKNKINSFLAKRKIKKNRNKQKRREMLKLMKKKERANKTEMKITKYTFLSFYLFYRNIKHRTK